MARMTWGDTNTRYFETGVDRGVFYLPYQPAVPWNGLTSVAEEPTGGEPKAFYLDGVKYLNISSAEEFEATIEAFSSPKEFAPCDGVVSIHNGLFATQQPRKSFGFSYRSLVGNDVDGTEHAYKIHLVYNALAAPSSRSNETMNDSTSPAKLSWKLSTLAPKMSGLRPTAHLVIDTREAPAPLVRIIEDILYGSESDDGRLPDVQELVTLFTTTNYPNLAIVNIGVNVWEIQNTDALNAHTVISPVRPPDPVADGAPILWLDTSGGNYAVPKLLTGA